MLSTKTAARSLAALVVASLAAIALTATASGADATTTIRIWTDKDRVAAVTKVANAWAASKGATIEVVQKDFGQIRDNLKTVQSETAPDVIVGAHDWIGELSANGSIVPLFPSAATRKQFPGYALDAFSYGTAIKKLGTAQYPESFVVDKQGRLRALQRGPVDDAWMRQHVLPLLEAS